MAATWAASERKNEERGVSSETFRFIVNEHNLNGQEEEEVLSKGK